MTKTEKKQIETNVAYMSDEKLSYETHKAILDTLGSVSQAMIERNYSEIDIKEVKAYEKYLQEKADFLIAICAKRNIELFSN